MKNLLKMKILCLLSIVFIVLGGCANNVTKTPGSGDGSGESSGSGGSNASTSIVSSGSALESGISGNSTDSQSGLNSGGISSVSNNTGGSSVSGSKSSSSGSNVPGGAIPGSIKIDKSKIDSSIILKTETEDSGAFLSWNASINAKSYNIYRSGSINGTYTLAATNITGSTYTDAGLLNRKTYYYSVQTVGGDKAGKFSVIADTKPDVQAYSWFFNRSERSFEGWSVYNAKYRAFQGYIEMIANGSSPELLSDARLKMDTAVYNNFEIKLMNATSANKIILEWTTQSGNAKSAEFAIKANTGAFAAYSFSLKSISGWSGIVSSLGLTLKGTNVKGNISIAYIRCSNKSGTSLKDPLSGAIRWDAWSKEGLDSLKSYVMADWFYKDYSYREPLNGWIDSIYFGNSASLPNHQEIMDKEIDAAVKGGLDYWAYDFSPSSAPGTYNWVQGALDDYLASTRAVKPKFSMILMPAYEVLGGNGEKYFDQYYVPELIGYFKNKNYLKVEGNRPVVFLLSGANVSNYGDWASHKTFFENECVKAGMGKPYFTSLAYTNIASCTANGLEGISNYGPTMGSGIFGSGHRSWQDMAGIDIANFNGSDEVDYIAALSPVMDPRGLIYYETPVAQFPGLSYKYYFDVPTYKEWEDHYRFFFENLRQYPGRSTSNPGTMLIYAWNELSEGGPGIIPTKQYKTMFLDAIKAVESGTYTDVYEEILNNDTKDSRLFYDGKWTETKPVAANSGSFNNDLSISSTAGDFMQVDQSTEDCIGFEIIGQKANNLGKMEIYIDNAAYPAAIIDCYNTVRLPGQVLYKSKQLAVGNHTIKVKVLHKNNGVSKGFDVNIDCVKVIRQRITTSTNLFESGWHEAMIR